MFMSDLRLKCCFYFLRPVSAYSLFFRNAQAVIKSQNPSATFGDISKIVASMWDNLDNEIKRVSSVFYFRLLRAMAVRTQPFSTK